MNSETCDIGETGILRTPLYSTHISLSARMIEFHGWEMPVEYFGIIEEHKAVRDSAGLFDVSHMNKLKVTGSKSFDFLQNISTNDISKLRLNGMKYSSYAGMTAPLLMISSLSGEKTIFSS